MSRLRITTATARRMEEGGVLDLFDNVRNGVQLAAEGKLGPGSATRVRKQYTILRAELKRRGYSDGVLDAQPVADTEVLIESQKAKSNALEVLDLL